MSCNFCKHIKPQGMTQFCPKVGNKEIIYDQSTDCLHYIPKHDAPEWVRKPEYESNKKEPSEVWREFIELELEKIQKTGILPDYIKTENMPNKFTGIGEITITPEIGAELDARDLERKNKALMDALIKIDLMSCDDNDDIWATIESIGAIAHNAIHFPDPTP